ncbi:auxin response factor 18-like [Durio zibethinus]|uniref:Auxin response factor n=1 Tax=Durio zibethinus TaxID=66656 RepID=A0A6P5ZJ19_DURZI|nr:auxin response factor 18-like [Durio zibethinus]XP_022752865.1 auxin response factor 18-like [Durio zibethinus]
MKEPEKSLDPELWHACAGSMVQIPPVNSKVFYFPQGHAEHSLSSVDFSSSPQIPALILCRVASVKFLADIETDEVYAKVRLIPLPNSERDLEDDAVLVGGFNGSDNVEKPASFAKTLTQSDANNGGGFSVPRYCAETIFPRLDYSADPPVQTVIAKDVHGEVWKFRHIYRGTPRRHLLTTGWSSFVNQKKLVAGDSIVFLRAENGDLCVGIRRAKRGIGNGPESGAPAWNSGLGNGNSVGPYGGFSAFLREDESKIMRNGSLGFGGNLRGKAKVRPEDILKAVALAAGGQPFEVFYYPRASTPEFCVKSSAVKAAMRIPWCSGMRFKMAFETEDSSRISWFMGTVSSVQVADPFPWPNSPWRLLQVTWDEPDLLQNVKRVSPWLVELVSNMPAIHLSPFSPPRKKLRLPQHLDFPLDGQFPMPSFSGNPLGPSSPLRCLSDNAPAGIQGARHAQFGLSLSDFHLNNKLQSGLFLSSFQRCDPHSRISDGIMMARRTNSNDNVSCLLTMGNCSQKEKSDKAKRYQFLLFGQPILTEQQLSRSCSSEAVSQVINGKSSLDGNGDKTKDSADGSGSSLENLFSTKKSSTAGFLWKQDYRTTELGLDTGHCKVFLESEDVGRTLDLSVLGSYEELYRRLANMFGIERSEILGHVLYRDATGAVKHTGDEPFSAFMKTTKRLTIRMDSGNDTVGRSWLTGMRTAENGPLSIFA